MSEGGLERFRRPVSFCDPHRARLGKLVPAAVLVAGVHFCEACFSGRAIGGEEDGDADEARFFSTEQAAARWARSPLPRRKRVAAKKSPAACLTRDQLIDLLVRAKTARYRDWILLLVTFWHGLKASEAIALTPANFVAGRLILRDLKEPQPLVSSATPLLNERVAIEAWIERHKRRAGGEARLFPISRIQLYRIMRRHARAAALPKHLCRPQALKRTRIAMAIREEGIDGARNFIGRAMALNYVKAEIALSAGLPAKRDL